MGNEIELPQMPPIVAETKERREAAKIANATPLPGALKRIFSVIQDIEVGPYKIRPFYDGDYDLLTQLGNPLAMFVADTLAKKESEGYIPTGKTAWEISYLFTNDIEQCHDEIKDGTFMDKARKGFWKMGLAELVEINNAVLEQVQVYWSARIGYKEEEQPQEGEVGKKK